jgi:hypothetical protein
MGCSKSSYVDVSMVNPHWQININRFEETVVSKDFKVKNFHSNINSCEFKKIVVLKNFEIENGVLGLERDVYLSIVKFLDSSNLRKV